MERISGLFISGWPDIQTIEHLKPDIRYLSKYQGRISAQFDPSLECIIYWKCVYQLNKIALSIKIRTFFIMYGIRLDIQLLDTRFESINPNETRYLNSRSFSLVLSNLYKNCSTLLAKTSNIDQKSSKISRQFDIRFMANLIRFDLLKAFGYIDLVVKFEFFGKDLFDFIRAQHVLSSHIIKLKWFFLKLKIW